MAAKRKLTDQDITEMILETNSDVHSMEDENISPQNDRDTK
jgi:hypothetical protein